MLYNLLFKNKQINTKHEVQITFCMASLHLSRNSNLLESVFRVHLLLGFPSQHPIQDCLCSSLRSTQGRQSTHRLPSRSLSGQETLHSSSSPHPIFIPHMHSAITVSALTHSLAMMLVFNSLV